MFYGMQEWRQCEAFESKCGGCVPEGLEGNHRQPAEAHAGLGDVGRSGFHVQATYINWWLSDSRIAAELTITVEDGGRRRK